MDYYTEFEEVTDKLMSEILIAEYEYAMYHDGDGNLQTIADLKNLWPLLLLEFYYNVKNDGPWDLKQHSEWQQSSLYYFNGELVDADAPGNIMFGYMGCAYGIPEMVLNLGAGAAQVSADTSSIAWGGTLFDDPMDAANISRGIELYKNIHS